MTTRTILFGLVLGTVSLLCGCDLEPEPVESTQQAFAAERVRLRGQRVAADDFYWGFTSHPV